MDGPCTLNKTTFNNCTAACLDPQRAFYSVQTVLQCFFNYTAHTPQVVDHFQFPWEPGLDPTCSVSTGSALASIYDACMQQYCSAPDPDLGGCPYNSSTGLCSAGNNFATCDSVVQTVNSELGGSGVSLFPLIDFLITHAILTIPRYSCHI